MVWKGHRKPLEMEDLWELRDQDRTQPVSVAFERHMQAELRRARRALEHRHHRRRNHPADAEHRNGLAPAQSRDVLVLVMPSAAPGRSSDQGTLSPPLPAQHSKAGAGGPLFPEFAPSSSPPHPSLS